MSDKTDEVRKKAEESESIEPESDSDDEPVFTIDSEDES
jgi:hypothetical protein